MKDKRTRHLLFLIFTAAAILFDQWTKQMAVAHLKGQRPLVVIDGVFELLYSENRGAAFGMLQGKQGFFFCVVILVLGGILYTLYRMPAEKKYVPLEISLFLVATGAVGNTIDRVKQGYVVDFLYFKLIDFPIFNVADCFVTIAAALLLLLFLFVYNDADFEVFSFRRNKTGDSHGNS